MAKAARPQCFCGRWEYRLLRTRTGGQTIVRQCMGCGRNMGSVPRKHFEDAQIAKLKPFDLRLREAWDQRWKEYQAQREERKRFYEEYLKSAAWKEKRAAVLLRDNGLCRICGKRATDVHHLTYEHLGNEYLFELVSLCHPCHSIYRKAT